MLGATMTEAQGSFVSVPPAASELSAKGRRDWKTGSDLIDTCVDTYQETATCAYIFLLESWSHSNVLISKLSPEIVYFRTQNDMSEGRGAEDWYIKGAQ